MRTLLASLCLALVLALSAPAARAQQQTAAPAVQQARGLAGKQDYRGARAALVQHLGASPGDAGAQELLGFVSMKLFLFDEACDAFARGDASDKYHEVNWGYCLRKAGRLVEALATLKRGAARIGANDSWSSYCQDQVAELEPLASAKAVLCVAQADDFVVAAVNGKAIGRARTGGEAFYVLDARLKPGRNEVRALAVNTAGSWAYRVRLYLGGKLVHSAGAGYAAKGLGAHDGDQTVGIVGESRLALEVEGADISLAEAREELDFDLVAERIRESEALWREGRFGEAIKIYERSGKEWPSLDWFHLRLAEACDELALTMQDATAEAAGKRDRLRRAGAAARERWIAVRRRVADLSGDDAGAWQAYATACSSIAKYDDAEAAFKKALSLDPGRVEAMVALADALVKQGGKGAEAKEWAQKAIEKAPHWSAAHCLLGDALLDQGDGRAALASYNRAVELDPTQGEWMYGKIAAAVNRGGANAGGIRDAAKALAESRNDAAVQKAYAGALMRGLRWEEALRSFQTAIAMQPDLPGVHPLMGLCYELTGKRDRAIQSYERGLSDADEALKALAERRLARAKEIAGAPPRSYAPPPAKPFEKATGDGLAKAQAELDVIKTVRPRIAEALRLIPPLRDGEVTAAEAVACERIQRMVQSSRARDELKRGLSLIEREAGERRGPPRIDGDLSEWQPRERVARDPAGDGPAGADLIEVYAVVRGTDLHLAWRTSGAPRVTKQSWFWAHIYSPKRGAGWLAVGVGPGDGMVVKVAPEGGREQMSASQARMEFAVGASGIEAKVPLSWIDGERRLQIEAYTLAGQQKLDAAAEAQPPIPIDDGYPASLLALFRLAEDGAFEADDRPALAIALSSGDLYALGDPALSAAVAEDDRRMLRFSRTVKLWQKGMGLPALDALALPPLLFWANRCVQWRPTDLAEYRRYSISPAALEGMFRFAQKRGWRGRASGDIVEAAEKFLIDPVRWQYTSYEMVARGIRERAGESVTLSEAEKRDLNKFVRDVVIDGRRQNTDGTFNPDLQLDYLIATDALLGHCGNLAQTVVDFSRALGVPATIVQGIEEQSKRYQNPHAFPSYYDGAAKAWKSFQGRKYKGIRQLTLFFFLPPIEPPEGARPTGGGSYYFPVASTYDETGPLFSAGYEAPWVRDWMQGMGAGGK